MNIVYKSLSIIVFTVLFSACNNSTPSDDSITIDNQDINSTRNLNIVDNNHQNTDLQTDNSNNDETSNVPTNNNETSDNSNDNNETSNNSIDNNETSNNSIDNNETSDNSNDNNETSDNSNDNNETSDVPTKNNDEISNIATVYEDAEDQKIDNWTITSNYSKEANISNTYDDEKNSRVIYLNTKINNGDKRSYDNFKFDGIDKNKENKFIQWDMKFDQVFKIRINITTTKGTRWIEYIAKDTGAGIYDDCIIHGIGSDKTNNKWHTITRDLDRDVKRYEADNSFIQMNYMTIQGGGYIDNIKSYKVEGDLDINKPVIVSKPGIVLTFDDSLIDNWNDMQNTFKEKGAVATFFCNRWASHQYWDLTDEQISLLKSFRANGHEIAYHTSDHLSTYDSKYANEVNKAQAYFDDQIIEGVTEMRNKGFEPRSFSYPYISGQPAHDVLIRQELPHIRAFFAHVTLTDDPANITLDEIRAHLEKLKEDKDIGVFLSHWILYEDASDETRERRIYRISEEKLVSIIDMVNELGLEFYTLSEAHNIYINQ